MLGGPSPGRQLEQYREAAGSERCNSRALARLQEVIWYAMHTPSSICIAVHLVLS